MPSLIRMLALAGFCTTVSAADLDKLAPANAEVAVVLNVKQLVASPLFLKLAGVPTRADLAANTQFAEFFKAAAFDLDRDLTGIGVASELSLSDLIFKSCVFKGCVLLRGNFNARFQVVALAAATARGWRIVRDGPRTTFRIPAPDGQHYAATFVGYDRLLLGYDADLLARIADGRHTLDPLNDVTSITLAAPLVFNPADVKAVVIGKGNFNVARLQAAVEEWAKKQGEKLQITKDGGLTYYTLPLPQGNQEVTGTFVGNEAALVSNNVDYLKTIATGKKIESTAAAKTLQGALAALGGKETLVVGVAVTDELRKRLADNPATKQYADKLESLTVTLHVAEAIDCIVSINTTDPDTAKVLGQLFKQALPLLNLLAAQNEQAKPLVEYLVRNLRIAAEGKAVRLRLPVSEAALRLLQPAPPAEQDRQRSVAEHIAAAKEALRADRLLDAERAVRAVQALDPQHPEVPALLAQVTARLRPDAEPARPREALVAQLVRDLRSPDRAVRRRAAEFLGRIGPAAEKVAVPALLRALTDADAEEEAVIRRALDKIVP